MKVINSKSYFIFFTLILFGCQKKQNTSTPRTSEIITYKEDSMDDSGLSGVNEVVLDWFSCKQNIQFLNCNSSIAEEKDYLSIPKNPAGFLYGYCLHNGNQRKDNINQKYKNSEKVIDAITFKLGKEIGYYLDKNEQLLFIKSKVSNEHLEDLDIIGIGKR